MITDEEKLKEDSGALPEQSSLYDALNSTPESESSNDSSDADTKETGTPAGVVSEKRSIDSFDYPEVSNEQLLDWRKCKALREEIDKVYDQVIKDKKAFSENYGAFHKGLEELVTLFQEYIKEINTPKI